jgi:putative membrane protein
MKLKILSSLVIGAAIVVSGCGLNSNVNYAPPVNYTSVQMQTDAKILGAVMAIDKNEISAATLAQKKSANPVVRNFASFLYNQHSQDLGQVQGLSQRLNLAPVNGEVARMLHSEGRHGMAKLSHLNNGAFDRAYISAMVKGHAQALHLIDNKLMPLAINPLVKGELQQLRGHVIVHLSKAQAIQAQLGR